MKCHVLSCSASWIPFLHRVSFHLRRPPAFPAQPPFAARIARPPVRARFAPARFTRLIARARRWTHVSRLFLREFFRIERSGSGRLFPQGQLTTLFPASNRFRNKKRKYWKLFHDSHMPPPCYRPRNSVTAGAGATLHIISSLLSGYRFHA